MPQSFWSLLQRHLQQQLDPEEFATWFRPLRVGDEDGNRLVLVAPNSRFLHTLEESYRPMVDRAVAGLGDPGFEVLFSLDGAEIPSDEPIAPSSFNPKYMFASFVDGKSNEFASAAAKRVADCATMVASAAVNIDPTNGEISGSTGLPDQVSYFKAKGRKAQCAPLARAR